MPTDSKRGLNGGFLLTAGRSGYQCVFGPSFASLFFFFLQLTLLHVKQVRGTDVSIRIQIKVGFSTCRSLGDSVLELRALAARSPPGHLSPGPGRLSKPLHPPPTRRPNIQLHMLRVTVTQPEGICLHSPASRSLPMVLGHAGLLASFTLDTCPAQGHCSCRRLARGGALPSLAHPARFCIPATLASPLLGGCYLI